MALKTKSQEFYNKTEIRRVMFITYKLKLEVSDGCIRDLGFNPRLHQKLIGVLV